MPLVEQGLPPPASRLGLTLMASLGLLPGDGEDRAATAPPCPSMSRLKLLQAQARRVAAEAGSAAKSPAGQRTGQQLQPRSPSLHRRPLPPHLFSMPRRPPAPLTKLDVPAGLGALMRSRSVSPSFMDRSA